MKKILSVDFDETLVNSDPQLQGSVWVSTGTFKPIARVCNFVFDKVRSGEWEAHIVTFRHKDTSGTEVEDFVDRYKLPIRSVVYTGGKTKTPFLKKLNSSLHVDDDISTCLLASLAGIEVLLVDHGQDKTNETAKLFPKI